MKTLVKMKFGSYLYGTNTENSDLDFKGVYLPEPRDIILGNVTKVIDTSTGKNDSKNTKDDIDESYYSLQAFVNLALRGDMVAIDMLHAPDDMIIETSDVWEFLRRNRSMFYTTSMISYLGYIHKQASKYGIKGSRLNVLRTVIDILEENQLPVAPMLRMKEIEQFRSPNCHAGYMECNKKLGEVKELLPVVSDLAYFYTVNDPNGKPVELYYLLGKKYHLYASIDSVLSSLKPMYENYGHRARLAETNQGIDWKAVSHAYRATVQLRDMYIKGDIVFPLDQAKQILRIKNGSLSWDVVQRNLEVGIDEVEKLSKIAEENGLQKTTDKVYWNRFVEDVYSKHIVNYYK